MTYAEATNRVLDALIVELSSNPDVEWRWSNPATGIRYTTEERNQIEVACLRISRQLRSMKR